MYDDRFAEGLIAGQNGSNRNDGGFGDNSWWVIIIFALLFGWGGNGTGFGGRGNGGGSGSMDLGYDIGKLATSNDVASGFASSASLGRLNDLMLGQAGIQQSLCQGFNGTNTALLQGFNGVERSMCNIGFQLENCCCQTQRAIDGVNYNMAKNTCDLQNTMNNNTRDIIDSQRAGTAQILDFLTQTKISDLQTKLVQAEAQLSQAQQTNNIVNALKPCPVPAYITCNPNAAYYGGGCGCGGAL